MHNPEYFFHCSYIIHVAPYMCGSNKPIFLLMFPACMCGMGLAWSNSFSCVSTYGFLRFMYVIHVVMFVLAMDLSIKTSVIILKCMTMKWSNVFV